MAKIAAGIAKPKSSTNPTARIRVIVKALMFLIGSYQICSCFD